MDASAAAHALVRALGSLTDGRDVVGALAVLIDDCQAALHVDVVALPCDAVGIDQLPGQDGPGVDDGGSGDTVVHVSPLRWHGATIGTMDLLRRCGTPLTADEATVAQAFADVAAGLIVAADRPTVGQLAAEADAGLGGRIVIEQAKGVVAQQHGLDMADAYDLMLRSWTGEHETLAEWSSQLVREADPG
jgi:hypothetical protein